MFLLFCIEGAIVSTKNTTYYFQTSNNLVVYVEPKKYNVCVFYCIYIIFSAYNNYNSNLKAVLQK